VEKTEIDVRNSMVQTKEFNNDEIKEHVEQIQKKKEELEKSLKGLVVIKHKVAEISKENSLGMD
jgi:hypothetical protein